MSSVQAAVFSPPLSALRRRRSATVRVAAHFAEDGQSVARTCPWMAIDGPRMPFWVPRSREAAAVSLAAHATIRQRQTPTGHAGQTSPQDRPRLRTAGEPCFARTATVAPGSHGRAKRRPCLWRRMRPSGRDRRPPATPASHRRKIVRAYARPANLASQEPRPWHSAAARTRVTHRGLRGSIGLAATPAAQCSDNAASAKPMLTQPRPVKTPTSFA